MELVLSGDLEDFSFPQAFLSQLMVSLVCSSHLFQLIVYSVCSSHLTQIKNISMAGELLMWKGLVS